MNEKLEEKCNHSVIREVYKADKSGIIVYRCMEYSDGQRMHGCDNTPIYEPKRTEREEAAFKQFWRDLTRGRSMEDFTPEKINLNDYRPVILWGGKLLVRKTDFPEGFDMNKLRFNHS